jgi:quinolinate synthase
MAMNGLKNLAEVLETGANEVMVDPEIGRQAKRAIDRMLDFAAAKKASVLPSGALEQNAQLFNGIGPA